MTRQAGRGAALPLASSGSTASATTALRTSRQVGSPISRPPGSAADCSREAVFMASPTTGASSPDRTTSPVVIPIRAARRIGKLSFSVSSRSCISIAARTARSPSSSWASGTPNMATTASPMNFCTRPPWRSAAERISTK